MTRYAIVRTQPDGRTVLVDFHSSFSPAFRRAQKSASEASAYRYAVITEREWEALKARQCLALIRKYIGGDSQQSKDLFAAASGLTQVLDKAGILQ